MDNKNLSIALIAVVVVGFAISVYRNYYQLNANNTNNKSGWGDSVVIESFSFNPETLYVKQGTAVVWTNNDSVQHTIKSDNFNSQSLSKGQTFEFKFENKGTYDYSCGLHPSMKGKIVVE